MDVGDIRAQHSSFPWIDPVFNVDILQLYFPPLLDTSEITEQLKPIELNPDCIQKETNDYILEKQIKVTF
jgi:hypothetical protein